MGLSSRQIRDRVRALGPAERRRFLCLLGGAVSLPLVPAAVRFAARSLAIGEAKAQELEQQTFFVEVNFREQMDLGHVMVPPSIAKHPNRRVGVNGNELTMFAPQSELKEHPNNVFLTDDSAELAPHIDTVAMLDTGEAGIGGVHGHEAAGGMRSPGRVMDQGASGLTPMWLNDGSHETGNEDMYGAVPTPATFHNYYQHVLDPDVRNGLAFKGSFHDRVNVYHFDAGLPNAELTRLRSKTELVLAYDGPQFTPTPEPTELVRDIMAMTAPWYRKDAGFRYDRLHERYGFMKARHVAQLALTDEENERWAVGVPAQQCAPGQTDPQACASTPEYTSEIKAEIWEQLALTSKLLRSGSARSVALEFYFPCLPGDGVRTEKVMRMQAQQCARPLARLITELKAAGLYERTVIATYLVDGSRQPAANSYGDNSKGTILLAGGRIKGGYYGDIEITADLAAGGHSYALRPPDAMGKLLPAVSNWSDHSARTPSGSIWRTVAKAMGIPQSEYVGKFHAAVDDAPALDFMLQG